MNTEPFSQTGQMIELYCEYLCVGHIWLYVIIMTRTDFRLNPHSILAWMSRKFLLQRDTKFEVTATRNEPTTVYFINEQSPIKLNWPNDWALLWVLILCCIWLYFIIMSLTCFIVNPHSIFAWTSRNSLLRAGSKSEVSLTPAGLEPTDT